MKKILWSLSLLFVLTTVPMHVRADEEEDPFKDDPSIVVNDEALRTCAVPAASLVSVMENCGINNILKQDFFLRTSPLRTRSVLDLPALQTPIPPNNHWLTSLRPFYNQTDHMFFSKDEDSVVGQIALCSNSPLVKAVEAALKKIKDDATCFNFLTNQLGINASVFDTDVKKVAGIFGNIFIQERRAGFMFDIAENKDHWTLGIKIPFYWSERNFNLPEPDREAINALQLFPGSSTVTEEEAFAFARKHLISDKLGIGDLRVTLAHQMIDGQHFAMHTGGFVTAPTAFALRKGLIGSSFGKCPPRTFDLCDILDKNPLGSAALDKKLTDEFTALGFDFVDRLSAMLIEHDLGNDNHWGLGAVIEPSLNYNNENNAVTWHSRASWEYLFPRTQSRFFIKPANPQEFNQYQYSGFAVDDDAIPTLKFLNRRILEMFFPTPFNVTVHPGSILNLTSSILYRHNNVGVTGGVDFWRQEQESFSESSIAPVRNQGFAIERAQRLQAHQLKILAGLSYTFPKEESEWTVSLNADKTIMSAGIGKDFTVSLNLIGAW